MRSVRESVFWATLERVGPQLASFGVGVLLARLLTPAEYGLVGMLAIFLALAAVFADCGLGSALIQQKEISPDDETSAFLLNAAAGVLLTVALCLLSPAVARFYRQPVLAPMLCVLAAQPLLLSLSIVQSTLLTRRLEFRTQALIGTVAVILSGAVGVAMASAGRGVWSLVAQTLVAAATRTALLWRFGGWVPRGRFAAGSVRRLWRFSANLLATSSLNTLFDNLVGVVIGRVYAPASLGLYTRANQLQGFPVNTAAGVAYRVAFPLFSRHQDDPQQMLSLMRRMAVATFTAVAVGMAAMVATADDLVRLLLTSKWHETVPILRVLCVAGALMPLHLIQMTALLARGHAALAFRLEIVKKTLLVAILMLTWRRGVMGMAWGMLAFSVLAYGINAWYNVRQVAYTWAMQARDLLPVTLLAVAAVVAVWPLRGLGVPPPLRMALQLAAMAAVFGAVHYLGRKSLFPMGWALFRDSAARLSAALVRVFPRHRPA